MAVDNYPAGYLGLVLGVARFPSNSVQKVLAASSEEKQ